VNVKQPGTFGNAAGFLGVSSKEEDTLRAKRSNPEPQEHTGLLRRFAPRNDAFRPSGARPAGMRLQTDMVNHSLPPAALSLSSPHSFAFAQPNLNALRRNWPGP
jgi:hypothetical protein